MLSGTQLIVGCLGEGRRSWSKVHSPIYSALIFFIGRTYTFVNHLLKANFERQHTHWACGGGMEEGVLKEVVWGRGNPSCRTTLNSSLDHDPAT